MLPQSPVALGQAAQDVGLGLEILHASQQLERLPTAPQRLLEAAQVAVDHAQAREGGGHLRRFAVFSCQL